VAKTSYTRESVEDRESRAARELIETSSDAVGAAVGGAAGLVGGPLAVISGAAGGVVVARVLGRGALEIRERLLAPRQTVRVADTYKIAADAIAARLMRGDPLRTDGFLDEDREQRGRPPAEELLEGVLLRASTEFEERKLKHLGLFYAALPFDTISPGDANYLLRIAGDLTYGQLVALALLQSVAYVDARRAADDARLSDTGLNAEGALAQFAGLVQAGLAQVPGADAAATALDVTGTRHMSAAGLGVRPIGQTLSRLMRLDLISDADLEDLLVRLGWTRDTPRENASE